MKMFRPNVFRLKGRMRHSARIREKMETRRHAGFPSSRCVENRFPVRWEKKIESCIAPPQLPEWCCDRLEEGNIDAER
jgi:hypothetical protein